MFPVLICVPVLVNGRVGFTCFLPNVIVLLIHTLLLSLLIVVSVLVNTIDSELNVGYLLHFLTVLGTLAFLSLGIAGYRYINTHLITAAIFVWFLTWISYLIISIISVSSEDNLKAMSVSGRCPPNFWIFDWCEKVHRPHPKNVTITANSIEQMDQESENSYEKYMAHNMNSLEDQISWKKNISSSIDESFIENELPVSQSVVSLTDIGGYQTNTSSPEHKKQLKYITGIFLFMLFIIYIYSMYGYVLVKILNQMNSTSILIITR